MRRLLMVLLVLTLTLCAGGGRLVLAQSDGPSPDSPTRNRDATPTADQGDQGGAGQDATPASDEPLPTAPDGPLDLAAMTLDSSELPQGYQLSSESYVDVDLIAQGLPDGVDPAELDALGIEGYYETTYAAIDRASQIRSYVIAYPDAATAEDGFALLEDEDRMVPADQNPDLQDAPGPAGLGEQPSEITTGSYGPANARQSTVDITFRVDRLAVGVAMETFDGSDPDQKLVEGLSADAEARVVAALTDQAIAGVDSDLIDRVVTFAGQTTFEGYQTVVDGYGDPNSPAAVGFVASYVRGATYSDDIQATIAPYVTVGVSRYEDAGAALDVLRAADQILPQFDQLAEVDVPLVDRSPTVAYQFASLIGTGDVDSVRLLVQADDLLVSIDAQGFAAGDDALAAALEVAGTAVDCAGGGNCGPVELPASPGGNGTPSAVPGNGDQTL